MIPESIGIALIAFVVLAIGAGGVYIRSLGVSFAKRLDATGESFANRLDIADKKELFYLDTAQGNQIELRDLRVKLDAVEKELDIAKQTIALLQNEREGYNSEVATLKNRVQVLEKQLEELVAQRQTLAQELSDEKLARQRDNSESAKEIASLKNEVKQILAAQMPPGAAALDTSHSPQEGGTIVVDTIEAATLTVTKVKPGDEKPKSLGDKES